MNATDIKDFAQQIKQLPAAIYEITIHNTATTARSGLQNVSREELEESFSRERQYDDEVNDIANAEQVELTEEERTTLIQYFSDVDSTLRKILEEEFSTK